MLSRIVNWVVGREPVAASTGLAAVVTAALGLAAAFGFGITPEQIAAVGALAAALAGWAARPAVTPTRKLSQGPHTIDGHAGSVPLALLILVGLFVVVVAGLATCGDALFEDEDERDDLGLPALVAYHDEDDGDGEDRRRKDTCFMFCDNVIIIPDLPGMGGGDGGEEPR